jgi:carbamoyltransferase
MRVLGIHDGHCASACLIEDGILKFAIQEERLAYEKNKAGFPKESIKYILKKYDLTPNDIDKIAVASNHTSPLFATGEYFKKHKRSIVRQYLDQIAKSTPAYAWYKKERRKQRIKNLTAAGFERSRIHFVDHHLCHAATAYFGSPFPRDEPILVITNDGAGDGLCATVSIAKNNQLKRIAEVKSSESLAGIYALITKMLGFTPLEHEYKLMGMAPYVSEKGHQEGYKIFSDLISVSRSNPLTFKRKTSQPISMILPLLEKRSRFIRFDYICAGLQQFTEDILVQWIRNCINHTNIHKIALAGGIFMNVKANKKIMELPEVEDLFIFPSCGDETVSVGAAYHVYMQHKQTSDPELQPLEHFYLGDDFSEDAIISELQKSAFKYKKSKTIEKDVAKLLAQGKVVARCKGRMEFGARALGNRSILADPSSLNCIREINLMVKKRDFWMPFAPAMLKERANDYIINKKNIESPYMILSFDTTEKYPEMIAAVHQADLTARPQMIDRKRSPEFHALLKEFEKLTGRGVILNTSFNLHGYPIVHGPKEALDVFKNSELKYLALGNYLIEKT